MSSQLDARTERALQIAVDLAERLFVLVMFVTFVVPVLRSLALRPYNLLALLSEGLAVFLILIRRPSAKFTLRPLDWVIALGGSVLSLLLRPGGLPLLPPLVGTIWMSTGLSLAIWAKLSLRRSFGLAAANRGPVSAGAYRLVRHPMYAGYLILYIGFLLNNSLPRNLVLLLAIVALLIVRILAEERVLMGDKEYVRYQSVVRFRLVPGVF